MKTIYDIYEGILDIDGTLERGDSFNELYNDAVEKIPTVNDFEKRERGHYTLTWDSESLFDMYRDEFPRALNPRIKGMGVYIYTWKGDTYIRWYMLDLLKGSKNKDFVKLQKDYNRIHKVGEWGYLDNTITSKKAMKVAIKQITEFVNKPEVLRNWLTKLEQQSNPYPLNTNFSILKCFPELDPTI